MSDNDTKPDGTTVDDAATPEATAEAAPTETAATAEPTDADMARHMLTTLRKAAAPLSLRRWSSRPLPEPRRWRTAR